MNQGLLGVVCRHHDHFVVSVHAVHAVGASWVGLGHHLSLNPGNLQIEHGEEMAAASLGSGSYWSLVAPAGAGQGALKSYCWKRHQLLKRGGEELVAVAGRQSRVEGLVEASRGLVGQSRVRVGQEEMASVSEEAG